MKDSIKRAKKDICKMGVGFEEISIFLKERAYGRVVIVPGGVAAVEGEEGDELHLVGKLNVQYSMFNV